MDKLAIRRSGFTIIELIVVVAVIAILASIAIPEFTVARLKSKQAERLTMLRAIEKTLFTQITEKDALFNPCGLGCTCINAAQNPTGPIDGNKRPFVPGLGDWAVIGFAPEGWLYHEYSVSGTWCPNSGTLTFQAVGDLDSNGLLAWYTQQFSLQNNVWSIVSDQASGDLF